LSKTTIDFHTTFKDHEGEDLKLQNLALPTMARVMSDSLMAGTDGANAGKLVGWAIELEKGNTLELDDSDYKLLQNFVKNGKFINIVKVKLEEHIEGAKDAV